MRVRRSRSMRLAVSASSVLMLLFATYSALAQGTIPSRPAGVDRASGEGVIVELSGAPGPEVEALLARELEAATDRAPQLVIGDDGRGQVADSTQAPYRSMALTLSVFGSGDDAIVNQCTSTFVGSRVLITAAHCFYSAEEGMAGEVLITPGINGESQPYPGEYAVNVWVPQPWLDSEDIRYDYALAVLADGDLGNSVGWLQIGVLSSETLGGADLGIHMAGYPGDKPLDTMWESSTPAFVQVDDYLLWHDMDTFGGQSGAAITRASDHAIVGIHNGGNEGEGIIINRAARIEEILLNDYLTACETLGCTIDYFVESEPEPTPPPGDGGDTAAFGRTWSRTDYPVASGQVARTWMWGPASFTGIIEEGYSDSPGGQRLVMYFDKSRMEITNPSGDPSSIWYITNGLLVVEMVSGNLQLGNEAFEQHQPAQINVAGDPDDSEGPTYATFAGLLDASALAAGSTIGQRVDRQGTVSEDPNVAAFGIQADHFVPETNHTIAAPFWSFMNSEAMVWQDGQLVLDDLFENPYFATGYPITEAYWATVRVGGTPLDVLVQCFERRCLTYNPSNPPEWQVEAGNVGLHYHQWRYELIPDEGEPAPTPPPDPDPTPTPPPDPDPTPTPPDNDGAPAEGEIIGQSDLSAWGELTSITGAYGEPGPQSYFLTTPSETFIQSLSEAEVGDGSFGVELRRVQPSAAGSGCILIRAVVDPDFPIEFNDAAYHYCLDYQGSQVVGLSIDYETPEAYTSIAFWEIENVELPGDGWHQLKIIAENGQFWLFLNGSYVGTVTHEGVTGGLIGISAWNNAPSGADARYEFTDLTIRALQ